MINLVCEKCGSEELEFDALAVWSIINQDYLYELCEGAWCNKCNDTVPVKEVEVADPLTRYIIDGIKTGKSTSIKANKD